jgi:hypothetical protein
VSDRPDDPVVAVPEDRADAAEPPVQAEPAAPAFDRHMVLEQLGGWRGMVDTSLPTIAFVLGDSLGSLRTGIWAAVGAAVLVFGLRLVRRQSVQQAFSGLFAVAIAVAIAGASGQARDFFVFGILRNAVVGVVLIGSIPVRWPLVGVLAEFLAPSHLGGMAEHSLPSLRRRAATVRTPVERPVPDPRTGRHPADPKAERHWRTDRRLVRAYGWLTLMWGATFLLRVLVSGLLYQKNAVGLLGVASLALGLPVTAVELLVTLWVVARLHRHRQVT